MTTSLVEELKRRAQLCAQDASRPKLSVLILDDDETDRLRLIRLLTRIGIQTEVSEAETVKAFCDKLLAQSYDVIFIDYWLGFENGLDALDLVLSQPNQDQAVPIMLSRATAPEVIVEAMRTGCADFVIKEDLDAATLRDAISAAYERRLMMSAMRESRALRTAIKDLIEGLAQGRVTGLAEAPASFEHSGRRLRPETAKRLSGGLLADLELLWHLRQPPSPF